MTITCRQSGFLEVACAVDTLPHFLLLNCKVCSRKGCFPPDAGEARSQRLPSGNDIRQSAVPTMALQAVGDDFPPYTVADIQEYLRNMSK